MTRFGILASILVLAAGAALAQTEKAPAAPGFDADACAKHCKEMVAARQKMMDEHKAMMGKHDAAMKEIHARLDEAKKSKGDRKVAALEAAVEQLISLHEGMMQKMGGGMMMHHGMGGEMHGMDCCGGMMGEMHGMGKMDCCAGGMHGMMDGKMGMDCPMGKKGD